MDLIHEGFLHERTLIDDDRGRLEKALADAWKKENATHVLFQLLSGARIDPTTGFDTRPSEEQNDPPITQRDATVAATIVRWIGTHMGQAFLEEAYSRAGWSIKFTSPESRRIHEEVAERIKIRER